MAIRHPIDRRRGAGPQLYRSLREQIITGALRPGDALSEKSVADQFGTSRTPVREAFIRLSEEGLLTVYPQVGTIVSPIRLSDVADSQFLREAIECKTIVLAARNAGKADRAELGRIIEEQEAACKGEDGHRFFALDEEMHEYLLRMSGRQRLWKVLSEAKSQLDRVRYLSLEEPKWLGKIFKEHKAIVKHVLSRDETAARAAMELHLRTVFEAIQRIADEHQTYFVSVEKEHTS